MSVSADFTPGARAKFVSSAQTTGSTACLIVAFQPRSYSQPPICPDAGNWNGCSSGTLDRSVLYGGQRNRPIHREQPHPFAAVGIRPEAIVRVHGTA